MLEPRLLMIRSLLCHVVLLDLLLVLAYVVVHAVPDLHASCRCFAFIMSMYRFLLNPTLCKVLCSCFHSCQYEVRIIVLIYHAAA